MGFFMSVRIFDLGMKKIEMSIEESESKSNYQSSSNFSTSYYSRRPPLVQEYSFLDFIDASFGHSLEGNFGNWELKLVDESRTFTAPPFIEGIQRFWYMEAHCMPHQKGAIPFAFRIDVCGDHPEARTMGGVRIFRVNHDSWFFGSSENFMMISEIEPHTSIRPQRILNHLNGSAYFGFFLRKLETMDPKKFCSMKEFLKEDEGETQETQKQERANRRVIFGNFRLPILLGDLFSRDDSSK